MEFSLVIKHETLVNAFFLSLKLKNEMIHPQDKKYSPNERQAFKQPPTLKECINPKHRLCSSLCLACCLLVSKVSNYTIVVSYIKSNPVHLKFAYFRPVHVNTENKHSLE